MWIKTLDSFEICCVFGGACSCYGADIRGQRKTILVDEEITFFNKTSGKNETVKTRKEIRKETGTVIIDNNICKEECCRQRGVDSWVTGTGQGSC